jgi:hypothetical protein
LGAIRAQHKKQNFESFDEVIQAAAKIDFKSAHFLSSMCHVPLSVSPRPAAILINCSSVK